MPIDCTDYLLHIHNIGAPCDGYDNTTVIVYVVMSKDDLFLPLLMFKQEEDSCWLKFLLTIRLS